jgi:hypothetical protein
MCRKITMLATIAIVVTTTAGYFVLGQAGAAPRFGNTFAITESGSRQILQDEATQSPPDFTKPIPPGDSIVFKADLLQHSTTVGEARGECTSVFDTKFVCNAVFSITGHGTLGLQVLFDLAHPEGDYVVTGGTGDSAGNTAGLTSPH